MQGIELLGAVGHQTITCSNVDPDHYTDVIMGTMASQITSLRLFTQPFIQAQMKENIKAPRHWSLCREFTGQMASIAENVSIWWRHHGYVSGVIWPQWANALLVKEIKIWYLINHHPHPPPTPHPPTPPPPTPHPPTPHPPTPPHTQIYIYIQNNSSCKEYIVYGDMLWSRREVCFSVKILRC